uniref:Uncharacterized protein n=1 Tax=Glossina palpalis gambiensis TaxID=67801 RepID=A0A1B0BX60_9MUSC
MARWPELPLIVLKGVSFACFLGAFGMEFLDNISLTGVFDSHCIAGFEVTNEIGHHITILQCLMIPDMLYALCTLASIPNPLSDFGADPTASGYNLVGGFLIFVSIARVGAIENCGNEAMSTILGVPASLGLFAALLHLVPGIICITIVYNVLAGLLAQLSLSKMSIIEDCGNVAMATILTVPKSNGSLIGILHFVNAGVCLIFLPVVERSLFTMERATYG